MLNFLMPLVLIYTTPAQAQSEKATSPKRPKSQYNSNLYEAEESKEDTKSFTAKVRVVRDISDDVEVLFEGDEVKGIYAVPRNSKNFAAMVNALEASRKKDGPTVSVSADADRNIKSVELNKKQKTFTAPSDPNQKWDFGKIPD